MLKFQYWLNRLTLLCLWLAVGSVLYFRHADLPLNRQQPIDFKVLTGEFDQAQAAGTFHGQKAVSQAVALAQPEPVEVAKTSNKRIEVDLTNQRLYAFEGDEKVYDFLISSGKWGRTPTGTFRIWGKFRYTKMSGGSQALHTYYYLPNVPFVMFFGNADVPAARGFSLHGTYWHTNFGHPMSHGCVNMKTEQAELIYYWSSPVVGEGNATKTGSDNPGTEIIIYGEAPNE